jgi:hypothetical protein
MGIACAAEETAAVDDVAFRGDAIAFLHIGDESSNLYHISSELMADDEWRLASRACPRVPLVDVHIRAAHSCTAHANQNFVVSDSRLGNIAQHESGTGRFFHECFHFLSPLRLLFTLQNPSNSARARKLTRMWGHWKPARI